MATLVATALIRSEAVERIEAAQRRLKKSLGVDPVELPTQGKDPQLVTAYQFAGFADYLDAVADAAAEQAKAAKHSETATDAPVSKAKGKA